ncbi:MAG: FMN-binding protein [Bacteroidota bacterium]|nr:FMN-binding protein [Bacteroidota bacterium]
MKFLHKVDFRQNWKKILISIVVLVLVIIVSFLPEQTNSGAEFVESNTGLGYNLTGKENKAGEYGSLEFDDDKNQYGYGYLKRNKAKEKQFGFLENKKKNTDSIFIARLKKLFPVMSAETYSEKGINYAILENKSIYIENIGVSSIKGFSDVIDLAVVINPKSEIDSVIYLSSRETPDYMNKIFNAGFFNQFNKRDFESEHIIDAVAGATISSVAIAQSVEEIIRISNHSFLVDYIIKSADRFKIRAELNKIWIINMILLLALFWAFGFQKIKNKHLRIIIYIFTVIWLGFYLNSSFTYLLFIKSFTGIALSVFSTVYILSVIFFGIWKKNTYCKHICPYGNSQRLIYKISPFKNYKLKLNNSYLKYFRYLVSIAVVTLYFTGFEYITKFEVFPHFFGFNLHSIFLWASIGILFISLIIPNLWCRALCPTGCVLDVVSDLSETGK